jgi:hypothetical protein
VIVDAGVPPGTAKREALHILVILGIAEFLGKAKVDRVDGTSLIADPQKEVVRLDIAMEKALPVNLLDSGDDLVGDKEDGLE